MNDERFWSKVDKDGPVPRYNWAEGACWMWTAAKSNGYGIVGVAGTSIGAHRMAYMLSIGPIPEGLELDHLCRNPGCVNPGHLEPVTRAENIRRIGVRRKRARVNKVYRGGTSFAGRDFDTVDEMRSDPLDILICRWENSARDEEAA